MLNAYVSLARLVQFNIKLVGLLFGVNNVSSEVTNTVVSVVLGGRHPCKLNKGEEGKDLGKSGSWDGGDSSHSGWDIRELQSGRWGKVSIEDDVVVVDDASNNGSHSNTSVLTFDGTTTFEGFWLGLEPSKRIENTKRLGDTKFELTDLKGAGGLARLGRGKGGGGTGKEGGNGELHLVYLSGN